MEPTADADAIKKAFRREIARYHPDKVTHLGPEFQEMASTRAAELTEAYRILMDPEARSVYDASLAGHGPMPPASAPPQPAAPVREQRAPVDEAAATPAHDPPPADRFEQERAGRDEIVRRAVLGRVRHVLQQVIGECEMPHVRGFDLACLSTSRAGLFRRSVPPSVLVKLTPAVDASTASEVFSAAVRSRIAQKPLILLMMGSSLAPAGELARAIEEQRRKFPAAAESLIPVPVDIRDWSAKIPAGAPDSVRALLDRLRNFVA